LIFQPFSAVWIRLCGESLLPPFILFCFMLCPIPVSMSSFLHKSAYPPAFIPTLAVVPHLPTKPKQSPFYLRLRCSSSSPHGFPYLSLLISFRFVVLSFSPLPSPLAVFPEIAYLISYLVWFLLELYPSGFFSPVFCLLQLCLDFPSLFPFPGHLPPVDSQTACTRKWS